MARPPAPAAPATINQRLTALTRFFRWVRSQGLCRENPAEDVSNIRLAPRQPHALDKLTLRKLLRAARSHLRDYALLEVLAGTGLRVGELLALTVGDVEIGERSGKVTVRRGKHEHYREVPLTVDVRKALRPIWKRSIRTKTIQRRHCGSDRGVGCATAVR